MVIPKSNYRDLVKIRELIIINCSLFFTFTRPKNNIILEFPFFDKNQWNPFLTSNNK
jgi:hypothetical protein